MPNTVITYVEHSTYAHTCAHTYKVKKRPQWFWYSLEINA